MDSTIIAAAVVVIGAVLTFFNVQYAGDLTVLVTSVATLIAAVVVWYQRTTLVKASSVGREEGDVSATGMKR